MDKIDNSGLFFHFNPETVKKKKTKKTGQKGKKTLSFDNQETSFQNLLQLNQTEIQQIPQEEQNRIIEQKLKQLGLQGEKLKKRRTLEDLDMYKKMVREFLNFIIKLAEKSEKKALWDRLRREKIEKVHLQILNHELLELTRIFFSEQQTTLAIAAKIDKIEGLLIDLKS